jgi:molybdenum cofactor biosynthesis protein B
MTDRSPLIPRVLVATVSVGRGSVQDDVSKIVHDELHTAEVTLVRGVIVNREKRFIQQLVMNIANTNEADVVILIGGVGFGPRDYTCEAVDELVDRRIEGFGEAFRRLLREDVHLQAGGFLQRATAGVFNKCIVFALPRQAEPVRMALRKLVIPAAAEAVRVAAQ